MTGLRIADTNVDRGEGPVFDVEAAQLEGLRGADVVVDLVRDGERVDHSQPRMRPHRPPDRGGGVIAGACADML